MKIYITSPGDPSVGIWAATAEMDLPFKNAEDVAQYLDDGSRENLRKEVKKFFEEIIFGDRVQVQFEDECPDCGHDRLENRPCENPNCISCISEKL